MRLEWIRPQSELQEVMMDSHAEGPEVTYWLFSDVAEKWQNMTVLASGLYGKEFPKTYGHYHNANVIETTKLIYGKGFYLLQKKHFENGNWISDMVDEVYLVKFEPNDEIGVPFEFGHSWTNVGNSPLIAFDDWNHGHVPTDYEPIKKLRGMSFYVTQNGGAGEVKFVPNPNYKNHPEPKVVSAKEFQALYPLNLFK